MKAITFDFLFNFLFFLCACRHVAEYQPSRSANCSRRSVFALWTWALISMGVRRVRTHAKHTPRALLHFHAEPRIAPLKRFSYAFHCQYGDFLVMRCIRFGSSRVQAQVQAQVSPGPGQGPGPGTSWTPLQAVLGGRGGGGAAQSAWAHLAVE